MVSAPRPRKVYYGWLLVVVFWIVLVGNLAFPTYGGAVLNSAMARDLGLSRQMLGLPYSVFLGMIGLSSPLVAWLIERLGIRWTLVLGNLSVTLGAVLMATAVRSGWAAVLVFGGIIGFGVASGGNLTTQSAIPRWFVRRRALAFAIVLTAGALGGALAAPATSAMIQAFGDWRRAWWVLATIALMVAVVAAVFVRETPAEVGQEPDGKAEPTAATGADSRPAWTLAATLSSWPFWVIGIASASGTGSFGVVLAHAVSNALDAGYGATEAAYSLSLISLSGLAGKLIVGAVGDRFNPALIWAGLMVCMALGAVVAAFGLSGGGLYVFAVLFGMGLGGFVVSQPTTVAATFGRASFARVAGLVFFIQALAGMAMPWAAGLMFDTFGSYRLSFALLAVACGGSAALLCQALSTGRVRRSAASLEADATASRNRR